MEVEKKGVIIGKEKWRVLGVYRRRGRWRVYCRS